LIKLGHRVHVFAPVYPGYENIDKEMGNPDIHRFSSYPLLGTKSEVRMVSPWIRKKVYAELDKIKPDIIHLQTEFPMTRFCRGYAEKYNIPMISTAHTYFEEYINIYYPYMPHFFNSRYPRYKVLKTYNSGQIVIAPSQQMADVLKSYKAKKPIFIIPTGIDEDEFKGTDKEKEKKNSRFYSEYPELKGKNILFYAGRIGAEKNIYFLLDVLQEVLKDMPDTMLVVAGSGPKMDDFKQMARAKGLDKKVIMLGYVNRELIKYWYALSDVLVFPSKTETQGLVTIESMFCGTPVVALGIMGTKFVMNGDNGGFMVDDNLDEFSGKVKLLLSDKKLYAKKSVEAKKYSKNWTSKKSAKDLEKIYEDVLSGKFIR
jgi:glycosyltransferase involved in cell wall biosynthesis